MNKLNIACEKFTRENIVHIKDKLGKWLIIESIVDLILIFRIKK